MSDRFVFGPFVVDVGAFRLLRDGAPVAVQPKALELLIAVLRAGGGLVENAQLRAVLWPDVVVTEQSLRQVLLKLRQALGGHEDWIETVPRKGLRYAGPPPAVGAEPPPAAVAAAVAVAGAVASVPAERDRFVGRGADLAVLAEKYAAGARLVTVLGPGGVGKTRLAVHFAREQAAAWRGGAWFCDLSGAWTLDGVAGAVAKALGVPLDTGDPIARIARGIAHRGEVLVVLDNFEQVASYAQDTLGRWLDGAPEARFVVTSRAALGVVGEHVVVVDPLAPGDAAALFADRSAAAGVPVSRDDPEVHKLVAMLDHLPLAIELAAARARVLSPARLAERIGERLDLLRSPTRADRHATLRATFDWSWELSSSAERAALAQLVVFEGWWSLAAAERVVDVDGDGNGDAGAPALEGLEALEALEVLHALVDRSWVQRRADDRFALLATVRAYAAEQLDPVARRAAEIRHGRWCAGVADEDAAAELPNLVAALRRAVAREDGALAAALLGPTWHGLELRGPFPLGLALATEVLALPLPAAAAGRVALTAGAAARLCGRGPVARGHFGAALAAAVAEGDRSLEAAALVGLGVLDAQEGRVDAAEPILRDALRIRQSLGDRLGEAETLHDLAGLALHRGALAEAEASLRAALALLGEQRAPHRAPRLVARTLGSLVAVLVAARRFDEAHATGEAALQAHRAAGSRRGECVALRNLGNAHALRRQYGEARACYEQALSIAGSLGDLAEVGVILGNLGSVDRGDGELESARTQFERALAIAREVSDRAFEGWILGRLGRLDAELGRIGDALARFDAAEALLASVGHAQALDEVRAYRAEAAQLAR